MFNPQVLLEHLKKNGCYLTGHFKLVSGKHSDSYIHVRIAMMNPKARQAFGEAMAKIIEKWEPTALAAGTIGSILLAIETSNRLGIPILIGRQVAKTITWVNTDELKPALGRIVLIDELLTTGGSIRSEILSLEQIGATVVGIAVAVDRTIKEENIIVEGNKFEILSLIKHPLSAWDPNNCPFCPQPYINLYNPEEDFLQVVMSMPSEMADMIIAGYEEVYKLQQDTEQLATINRWKTWLPSLLAGLPRVRVGEDSGLAQFIRQYVHHGEKDNKRKRVLTELVGHLLLISQIRVEARSIGCSILIGEEENLRHFLYADAPLEIPFEVKSDNFNRLIPYYDTLPEAEAVFLFNKDGELFGIKRLIRSMDSSEIRGIQLLRQITGESDSIGFVVRRDRKALILYKNGRLDAVAELSEKTGVLEFTTPRPIVEEIENLVSGIGRTLEIVLEISREMVTRGYGGLFVVGDVPTTLHYNPPKIKVVEQPLVSLGTNMAAEIAKLDGAVFISKKGNIQKASIIILNTVNRDAISEISNISLYSRTGGSRREVAYQTSKECPKVVIVCISQNGTIEIFVNGKSWPVSEAITGVS